MVVSSVSVRLKVNPPLQHRAVAVGLSLCNHLTYYSPILEYVSFEFRYEVC